MQHSTGRHLEVGTKADCTGTIQLMELMLGPSPMLVWLMAGSSSEDRRRTKRGLFVELVTEA